MWTQQRIEKKRIERKTQSTKRETSKDRYRPAPQELVADLTLYLSRCQTKQQRFNAQAWLESQYGDVEFSSFGYGSFRAFCRQYGLYQDG